MEQTPQIEKYITGLTAFCGDPKKWIPYHQWEAACGLSILPAGAKVGSLEWDGYTSRRFKEVQSFNAIVQDFVTNKDKFFQLVPKYNKKETEWQLKLMSGDALNKEATSRQLNKAKSASRNGVKLTGMLMEKNSMSKDSKNSLIAAQKVFDVAAAFTERTVLQLEANTLKDYAQLPGQAIQQALEHIPEEGEDGS